MPISKTKDNATFPYNNISQENAPNRYASLPTPADMKARSLFGIPLKSFLTGDVVQDSTLQAYIDASISEIEHMLDMYVAPVTFEEPFDYSREMQLWSFGYLKLNHSPILNVEKFVFTFNNSSSNPTGRALVEVPLEFIHVQPQEGTIQLVPVSGASISGFVSSLYSGLGYHAFNSQAISNWPGALVVTYTCGFAEGKLPAMLVGLIENMAAYKFLSSLGPVLFPHNSVSIGIDGTSQSIGTLGPAFLQNRLADLEKIIEQQKDAAKGYYQKRFLIDYI